MKSLFLGIILACDPMGPAGDQGSPSTAPGATRAGLETAGGVERLNLGALAAARETCDPSRVAEWDGGAESASSAWAGSPVVSDMRRGSLGDLVAASTGAGSRYERWRTAYPCALEAFEGRLAEQLRGKRIVLFTDYDGTLAPIVRDPELAFMSPSMRLIRESIDPAASHALLSSEFHCKVHREIRLDGGCDFTSTVRSALTADVILHPA